MTTMSRAAVHEPAWIRLASSDPQHAAAFYRAVLGWEITATGDHLRGSLNGTPVAAIVPAGTGPSGWLLHVEVADLDAALDAVTRAGGATLAPAATDADASVAVAADRNGTRFALRESTAPQHGRSDAAGAFAWGELITDDVDASAAFYGEAFGWAVTGPEGPLGRREWQLAGRSFSGLLPRPPAMAAEIPAYWDVYFAVADLDEAAAVAVEHGGTQLMARTELAIGAIAVFLDPTGAVFTLVQPTDTTEEVLV